MIVVFGIIISINDKLFIVFRQVLVSAGIAGPVVNCWEDLGTSATEGLRSGEKRNGARYIMWGKDGSNARLG